MRSGLLPLARRHRAFPGVRVWFCPDGSRVAALAGDFTRSGEPAVRWFRNELGRAVYTEHPIRPEGAASRALTRKVIASQIGASVRDGKQAPAEPDERMLLEFIREILSSTLGSLRLGDAEARRALVDEKWVRVMCDYWTEAVWAKNGEPAEAIHLPISVALLTRLLEWQEWYDRECPYDDDRPWAVDAFSAEGEAIARALKAELPEWTVVYFHEAKAARIAAAGRDADRSTFEYEILHS